MLNIKVLATEDEAIHAEKLRMVLDTLGYQLIDIVSDPNQLLTIVNATKPDVLLMDINLGGSISGIELVQKINEMHDIPTVFLTSFTDNQTFLEAKRTLPVAYITKPYKGDDLIRAIELAVMAKQNAPSKIYNASKANAKSEFLFLKNGDTLSKVAVSDIKLIEASDKYCYIFTSKEKYTLKERLKNVVLKLSDEHFCQVHRKYVLNIEAIETINTINQSVTLLGKTISIGKTYKGHFLSHINALG